jgi:eukaryotic-like serine/threonine-protein kinase
MTDDRVAADAHPTPAQLDDFGRGAIDGPLTDVIERHLADCADCLRTLEASRSNDPWLELLRVVGPADSPDAAGPALPLGYELEALIGRGGMGVVHRARQLGLDRRVALKTIAAGRDASPQLIERFRREFEAVASLNHPAIVPIHDVGVRDGVPFFAMELLEGGSLADRLAAGPLPISAAVALAERLARAIDYAHRRGIVHRDLKPSNILFDAEGEAKVADFGLAKRLDADDDAPAATRSNVLLGTPSYMAPEQAAGRTESVGAAVDVHALGAILFECLAGRPPFLASSPLETLELIRTAEPPSPTRFRPDLPPDLGTICLTCLEKDPARRYASAASLADDLGRFSRGETILARPAGPLDRAAKWARRRPAEAAFAALLFLSLAGTIGGLLAHQARLRAALDREAAAATDARRQRGITESNYRDARDAITGILAALSDPKFAGSPRLAEVHHAQAEAALAFYDRILARIDSSNPMFRRDTAKAAVEAANLQITLGRPELAEVNLLRAQRLYEALLTAAPSDRGLLREQMIAHIKLGVFLTRRDTERSVAALEQALALARRRAKLAPTDADRPEKDLAWCEHNLGSTWLLAGRHDRAVPHFGRAVALYEEVMRQAPDDVTLRVELAQSLVNLGLAHAMTNDPAKAETNYREADDLLIDALAARPGVAEYVATRCDLLVNWGNLDVERGQVDAGIARLGDGVRELLPLLNAEPNVIRLNATAINLHGARALALEKAGRFSAASKDWARVIALNGSGPLSVGYAVSRLLCLARGGDHRAVATEAAPLEARADLPAIDLYNLGCALALASSASPANSPDRSRLQPRAVNAVARAVDKDPRLRDSARHDADLRSLADVQAFRHVLDGRSVRDLPD